MEERWSITKWEILFTYHSRSTTTLTQLQTYSLLKPVSEIEGYRVSMDTSEDPSIRLHRGNETLNFHTVTTACTIVLQKK